MRTWKDGLHLIPAHMHDGVTRWIENGFMTGDFMTALMSNDLIEAMGRADDDNANAMRNWCIFLVSYAPRGCFGSISRVSNWRSSGGLNGLETRTPE